jgi:transposase
MARALSYDLRQRVVAAIASGMSRRQAAEWFGVSAASAIRWQKQQTQTGTIDAVGHGGDRGSHRIDVRAVTILALYEAKPDITRNKDSARGGEKPA